ncbi:hypothetical protein ACFOYU_20115 [Microvirga sp. GCM10011540]|uniref:hypothetical protein n=1 Tax=Microvirga sp. GCM10011540 TaxID=3317338 RepID=UPI0036164B93
MTRAASKAPCRASTRPARKPKAAREAPNRASLVFRDFVRQLEKLDARPLKAARGGAR